jgi:phospholipid-transporting ATPase
MPLHLANSLALVAHGLISRYCNPPVFFQHCRSNVDRVTNRIMGVIFAAMAFITTTTLIGYGIFKAVYQSELYYVCFDRSAAPLPLFRENCVQEASGADILLWFTFLILYNNFIPISLYVTLEIVNAVQADYIDQVI